MSTHWPVSQQVGTPTSTIEMVPEKLQPSVTTPEKKSKALNWEVFVEKAGIWDKADFVKNGFVDHINATKDTTDYLWYTTRFVFAPDEIFLLSFHFVIDREWIPCLCTFDSVEVENYLRPIAFLEVFMLIKS